MKRIFQATIIVALILSAIRPSMGQLTINGDVSVVSNLTAKAINSGTCTLTRLIEIHKGFADGYLNAGIFEPDMGIVQAYSSTGYAYLGLNSVGGSIGIGTWDNSEFSSGLTVGPSAQFESDVEVDGKLNLYGGMDPPYLLLDSETRSNIADRVAREVPPSKQTGAALFWNSQTKQLEVYVASEGSYYDLTGKLLVAINPPVATNTTVISGYRIDPVTGGIVTRQSVHAPRWQLKSGYRFNSLTGVFTQVGSDSNAVPEAGSTPTGVSTQAGSESNATPVAVSAQEALELK